MNEIELTKHYIKTCLKELEIQKGKLVLLEADFPKVLNKEEYNAIINTTNSFEKVFEYNCEVSLDSFIDDNNGINDYLYANMKNVIIPNDIINERKEFFLQQQKNRAKLKEVAEKYNVPVESVQLIINAYK